MCNVAASGGSTLTIVGFAFGEAFFSPKAALSSSQTEAMLWTSSSSLSLKISRGLLVAARDSIVSIESRHGSVSKALSFNVPSLSSIDAHLVAATGCSSVTAIGANMGSFSVSMKLVLGRSVSSVSTWVSDSSFSGKVAQGAGRSLEAVVSCAVDNERSKMTMAVSFDSPIISSLNSNAPKSGSTSLTLTGRNFAVFGVSSNPRVHGSTPQGSRWISESCIVVKVSSGLHAVVVIASVLQTTASSSIFFTYNGASLSSCSPTNIPTSGSFSISIVGMSFATTDISRILLRFSKTSSETVRWMSDSAIVSKFPNGIRDFLTVKLSINVIMNSMTDFFQPRFTDRIEFSLQARAIFRSALCLDIWLWIGTRQLFSKGGYWRIFLPVHDMGIGLLAVVQNHCWFRETPSRSCCRVIGWFSI